MIDSITYSVPSFLIPAIINSDYSDLTNKEKRALNSFLHDINGELHTPYDMEESFNNYHDLIEYGIKPCGCIEMICIPN